MTKHQVKGFRQYVQEKDPEFYKIMDTVCIFAPSRDHEDYCYLLENAFGTILPSEANKKKYSSLLTQYKKDRKIYGPVPNIGDDFADYLLHYHERLTCKLNGNFNVIFENGKHSPVIDSNGYTLSKDEMEEFRTAWINFSNGLTKI
jgi:hypothetical protein